MAELSAGNQTQTMLSQLRDIHMPPPAKNWPPAPGWIILLLGFIVIYTAISIFIKRNYVIWQTKKHALQLLKNYKKQFSKDHNSQKACALVNEVLKKTAFFYYPRATVASLKGQEWLDFLNQTMHNQAYFEKNLIKFKRYIQRKTVINNPDFNAIAKELLEYPYQNPQNINLDKLFILANYWIKNQRNFKQNKEEQLCSK